MSISLDFGDKRGMKIFPLGQGEFDLTLWRAIVDSGYRGHFVPGDIPIFPQFFQYAAEWSSTLSSARFRS
mgnify:CR=1 FL=1